MSGRRGWPSVAAAVRRAACRSCSPAAAVLVSAVVVLAARLPGGAGDPGRLGRAATQLPASGVLTATLVWNTVSLVVVVTVLCAVVGTLAAWFVERTDLPFRRFFAIVVVDPARHPRLRGELRLAGHLPLHRRLLGRRPRDDARRLPAGVPARSRPACAAADPAQEEVARSLGLGRVRTFWTVTVGQARLAIFGGAILVGLVVLAEFGAFEILGLPDPDHRDLQRVPGRLQPARRLRALAHPRSAGRPAPGQRRPGPGPGPDVTRRRRRRRAQNRPVPLGRARPAVLGRRGAPGGPGPRGARWARSST